MSHDELEDAAWDRLVDWLDCHDPEPTVWTRAEMAEYQDTLKGLQTSYRNSQRAQQDSAYFTRTVAAPIASGDDGIHVGAFIIHEADGTRTACGPGAFNLPSRLQSEEDAHRCLDAIEEFATRNDLTKFPDRDRELIAAVADRALSLIEDGDNMETEAVTRTDGEDIMDYHRRGGKLNTREEYDEYRDAVRAGVKSGKYHAERYGADRTPELMTRADVWEHDAPGMVRSERDLRARSLAAVEATGFDDRAAERATRMVEKAEGSEVNALSAYLVACGRPAYRSAFAALMRDPGQGHLMWDAEQLAAFRSVQQARTAFSLGSTGMSGFLAPTLADPSISYNSTGGINPMRELATVVQVSGYSYRTLAGAVTANYTKEGVALTDGTPALTTVEIFPEKSTALITASWESEQDSAISSQIGRLIGDARDVQEATGLITGTGHTNGQPDGVVPALVSASKTVDTATLDVLASADVSTLVNAVPARWRGNMSIVMHPSTLEAVRAFVRGSDQTGSAVSYGPNGEVFWSGRRIYEASGVSSAITTSSAVVAVAGDFREFVVADRLGVNLLVDPLTKDGNGAYTGQTSWVAHWRSSGGLRVADGLRGLAILAA